MAEVLPAQDYALCQHGCHDGGYRPPATILLAILDPADESEKLVMKHVGICDECQHVPLELQKQIHHTRLDGHVVPFMVYFVQDTRLN